MMDAAASPAAVEYSPTSPAKSDMDMDDMAGAIEEEDDLRDIVRLYEVHEREAARQHQAEVLSVVEALGGNKRAFRRERARKTKAIIAEFYSPPRISALAKELPGYDIAPGLALDLTTHDSQGRPWDFSKAEMREEAERLFDEQKPTLLVGTPMCTAFSTWQFINNTKRDPGVVAKELAAGRIHLAWMCKMYLKQLAAGRLFLHEHPANATSWTEQCVLEVLQKSGVARVTADQCQLGQQTEEGEPIRKPTGFMSNCPEILRMLHRRCTGRRGVCSRPRGGSHQLCHGKVARRAAIFQRELCEAVLIGLRSHLNGTRQSRVHEQGVVGFCGIMTDGDDDVRNFFTNNQFDEPHADAVEGQQGIGNVTDFGRDGSKTGWAPLADDGTPAGGIFQDAMRQPALPKSDGVFGVSRHERFVDDLTGLPLPEDLCRAARAVELGYFAEKEVWTSGLSMRRGSALVVRPSA